MKRTSFWRGLAALVAICLGLRFLGGAGVFQSLAHALELAVATAVPASAPAPVHSPWDYAESALPLVATTAPEPAPPPPTPEPTPAARAGELAFALPAVRNGGSLAPDYLALLRGGWSGTLAADRPQILILHTHTCEAYTPAGADSYEASEPGRTLDKSQSVVRVGDALAQRLEEQGFQVLHDRELYDWPGYSGAYDRSAKAVTAWLEKYPSLRVVIDLHRDALGGQKTAYEYQGDTVAQVMLLLTTGEAGLYHPNWQENLTLGLLLQCEMQDRYDGLARPLYLSPARYNQHLSPGFFILEVGADANTLSEAVAGVTLFADCAGAVLANYMEGSP